MNERYWQNWDKGNSAERIDEYWVACEGKWREMLVRHIKSIFGENIPLVEVGCGSGLIFKKLAEYGVVTADSYLGGDVSQSMLNMAHKRCDGVPFLRLDIFHLPFRDRAVENLINIQVLQHLPGYTEALSELIRVTKRRLYIATWFVTDAQDVITIGLSGAGDKEKFHNNMYSLPKFIETIKEIGSNRLKNIQIHRFTRENFALSIELE